MDQLTRHAELQWVAKGLEREMEELRVRLGVLESQRIAVIRELEAIPEIPAVETFNASTVMHPIEAIGAARSKRRRVISEETRQKQAERMRERWAKVREAKIAATPKPKTAKKKAKN